MTKLQYDRWCDFSMRMAQTAFKGFRRPNTKFIVGQVEFVLSCVDDEEWPHILDWDHSEGGRFFFCDHLSELQEHIVPGYWSLPEGDRGDRKIDRWMSPIRCCLRAGLDIAVSPSAGVQGFTAGTIRKMYPEGVPEWIVGQLDDQEQCEVTGVIPGVGLVLGDKVEKCPPFAAMPDNFPIWL